MKKALLDMTLGEVSFALQICRTQTLNSNPNVAQVRLMQGLDDPHIVKYLNVFLSENKGEHKGSDKGSTDGTYMMNIVLELMRGKLTLTSIPNPNPNPNPDPQP